MADDDRDPRIAARLPVEPLDEVTRRRLVATALRESEASAAPPPRSSRAWQWVAAAAAIVVLVVGGLALLTAGGGHDEPQASRDRSIAASPEGLKVAPDVGDFGDLGQAANLDRLRSALDSSALASAAPRAEASTPPAAGDAAGSTSDADAAKRSLDLCASSFPGGTILALGSGTIDGRTATVFLVQQADGSRSLEAVLDDPCETRRLS